MCRLKIDPLSLLFLVLLSSIGCQDLEPSDNDADVQEAAEASQDSDSAKRATALLNRIVDYGLEQSKFLKDVQERELFDEGLKLDKTNPAHFVGVFNKEKPRARELSEFAYASLEASSLLARQ